MQGTLFYEGGPYMQIHSYKCCYLSSKYFFDKWADLNFFFLQKNFATFENINTVLFILLILHCKMLLRKKFCEERANANASYGN